MAENPLPTYVVGESVGVESVARDQARASGGRPPTEPEGAYREEHAGQAQPDTKQTPEQEAEQSIVDEAVEFLAFVKDTESAQRTQEDEDLHFEGIDAWLPEHRDSRNEHIDDASGQKVPARPTISVCLLDQPLQQTINEARQARLALTVKPRAGLANTKVAGHFKGLVRAIQVESGAQDARLWALERAARCGRGAYQIRADYANDGDFDIDLIVERILDQGNVFWDPYSIHADKRDAEKCLTTEWLSESERKRRWKDKPLIPPPEKLEGATGDHPWFQTSTDGTVKSVLIALFHKVEHETKVLAYHPQVGKGWLTEMPPAIQAQVEAGAPGTQTRDVDVRTVAQYTVDGTQVLERKVWLGRYIPVIPVIGKEYLVRGKRSFKGIVTNTKDIIRAINVMLSSATEIAGSMPRVPYIMAVGADTGVEEMWDDAAVKGFTRLYYNPKDIGGHLVPPPARQSYDIEIQGLMFLLKILIDMFHSVTGSVAPSQRAVNPYDRSGKAIEALQKQGAMGTSNYLDNLATVSMMQEGRSLVDAIPKYYDKAGRILMVMGEENDDETAVMIKVPFIRDEEGNPVAVPCPTCQGQGVAIPKTLPERAAALMGRPPRACDACQGTKQATRENMPAEYQDQAVEYVDFADGEFKVAIAVERQFRTQQEEALAGMLQFAQAVPELVPVYSDLLVRAMGFTGSGSIADRLKANNPAAQSEQDLKAIPPRLRAQFQLLQSKHQQAMQALEEAHRIIETDQVKAAGQKELALIKMGVQERVEALKLEGKRMQTDVEMKGDAAIEVVKGQIKTMQMEMQHKHELLLELLKEKGAMEEERHSVDLHDAAAAKAAERADLSADVQVERDKALAEHGAGLEKDKAAHAATLESGQAAQGSGLKKDEATHGATLDKDQAAQAAQLDKDKAAHQATIDDRAASRQATRDDTAASRQAARDQDAADREAAREQKNPPE